MSGEKPNTRENAFISENYFVYLIYANLYDPATKTFNQQWELIGV